MSDLLITSTLTDATISVSDTDAALTIGSDGVVLVSGVTSVDVDNGGSRIVGAQDIIDYVQSGPLPLVFGSSPSEETTLRTPFEIPTNATRVQITYIGTPFVGTTYTLTNKKLQFCLLANEATSGAGYGTTNTIASGAATAFAWSGADPKISGTGFTLPAPIDCEIVYCYAELNRLSTSLTEHVFSFRCILEIEKNGSYGTVKNVSISSGYLRAYDAGNAVTKLRVKIQGVDSTGSTGIVDIQGRLIMAVEV